MKKMTLSLHRGDKPAWSVIKIKCVNADSFSITDSSIGSIQTGEKHTLSLSTGLLLVAPVGFRPNSMFYGFQLELDQLEQKLANQKRGVIGTCAVLLWGSPGSGKSQIAREYLWRHRNNYTAGCFWVDCKTHESRSKSYWEIAQAVAILGIDHPISSAWDESSKFVDSVRKWFESQEGWLLVFDGVTTDNDDDIQAFVPFIPDRSGNNIIYTSVDRTLARRQRLLNPAGIKVFPLSQRDACSILYKNLGIKEPTAVQAKKSSQLVKHYECLPLAIHAASHMLIARGTSLEKYSPGVSDHRLADPFLDIMAALRDHLHPEAVNLVTILGFFAHSIPVALLRFGIPALQEMGIEIRSVESIGSMKKELDNTIAVLIRYGLVERTLLEYSVTSPNRSASPEMYRHRTSTTSTVESSRQFHLQLIRDDSSSIRSMLEQPNGKAEESSQNSITYSIDILRIHSVVQGVLRDELKFRYADQPNQYWWWLGVASRFLCHSYAVADEKIRASEGRGLVRDYRDYETHAARLWSHFPRSAQDASPALRKIRHQLHDTIRTIKKEIQSRSPSHSVDSIHHRVQASVFERANSTSSDSPESDSGMTRTSTWTLEGHTESPTQMHHDPDFHDGDSDSSWTDRWSQSGMGNSRVLIPSGNSTRRPSESLTTPIETTSRRSSVLQAIFQGRPSLTRKPKDLGEWKPALVPPTLSQEQAQTRSRSSSFASGTNYNRVARPTSTGSSEASAALAAVHRASPPASRGGRIKSPSRPQSLDRSGSDETRHPLANKSPNLSLSPLASEFHPSQSMPNFDTADATRRHSRHPSASPRLVQTALVNQAAARIIPPLQIEENISITRRVQVPLVLSSARTPPRHDTMDRLETRDLPSGYMSQPMSRDTSRESNLSLATAPPAVPGSASLSSSPQIREPYLYSRPGLASIDVVAANTWTDGVGEEFGTAKTTPLASSLMFDGSNIFERYYDSVQFGQMSPVELGQARARVTLAREKSTNGNVKERE